MDVLLSDDGDSNLSSGMEQHDTCHGSATNAQRQKKEAPN
jgi:hypothetical protein